MRNWTYPLFLPTHNIEEAFDNAELKAISVSDWTFNSGPSFWVGHLIGAYEGPEHMDFDGVDGHNEFVLFGISKTNTNMSWVFHETIRDYSAVRAAEPVVVGQPRHVGEAKTLQRIPLHETGHLFGLRDYNENTDPLGVMNYDTMAYFPDNFMNFTHSQLGRIQAQPEPRSVAPPQ